MSQQIVSVSQAEEEKKIQMLHQLRELKKAVKNSSNDRRRLTLKETDDKARYAEVWEKRRQEKLAAGKKVNIVFVCSRPAIWGSLKSVCQAFIEDPRCNVKIIAIPEREPKPGVQYNHNRFSDLGAYDLLVKSMSCRVINGYNENAKTWLPLERLEPDYIFFQTQYNVLRPQEYASAIVARYAKICFINYGISTFSGDTTAATAPQDFMRDIFAVFTQTQEYHDYLTAYYKGFDPHNIPHLILSGEARFDLLLQHNGEANSIWNYPEREDKFKIIWTPRWTRKDGQSHFLDYKDAFFELCDKDKSIDFICRPHPLTFPAHIADGDMTADEVSAYKNAFAARENASLDSSPEYQSTFLSSSALVTDLSSIIHEYAMTGKPVIYCHSKDTFNDHSRELAKGFYWARSWDDVARFIDMLKNGEDPLYEKRRQIIKNIYYMPEEGVGNKIKNSLMKHFCSGIME